MTVRRIYLLNRRNPWVVIPCIIVFAAVNAGLERVNAVFGLPLFLDSVFTAVGAALFGIVPGAAVGVLTNLLMDWGYGWTGHHWPWFICNVSTAVVVGTMVRVGRFSTLMDGLITALAVTLTNSILGSLIATYYFGSLTGSNVDFIVGGLVALGQEFLTAAFLGRLLTNFVDKSLAVFSAFLIWQAVAPELKTDDTARRPGVPSV